MLSGSFGWTAIEGSFAASPMMFCPWASTLTWMLTYEPTCAVYAGLRASSFCRAATSADHAEGVQAFVEKRKAKFTGA